VAVAAVVVLATGWDRADPVASMAIGVLILASSWAIVRDSVSILLEATPAGIDADGSAPYGFVEGVVGCTTCTSGRSRQVSDALGARARPSRRRLSSAPARARAAPEREFGPSTRRSGRARRRAERASDRASAPPRALALVSASATLVARRRHLVRPSRNRSGAGDGCLSAKRARGLQGPRLLARPLLCCNRRRRDSRSALAPATACSRASTARIDSTAACCACSTSAWSRVSVRSISSSLADRSSSAASRSAIRFSTPSIAAARFWRSSSRADGRLDRSGSSETFSPLRRASGLTLCSSTSAICAASDASRSPSCRSRSSGGARAPGQLRRSGRPLRARRRLRRRSRAGRPRARSEAC
jgi:hypothetical protein